MDCKMKWKFAYTVECAVSRAFAWQFWSNIENWAYDPSIESVTLDGPFATGTRGVTRSRGFDPIDWQLIEVEDGHRAVIGIELPGAVMRFHWRFEELPDATTRITEEATLDGDGAADYMDAAAEFEKGIPDGMRKLADVISKAADVAAP
jgi:Polyketide cyclase / dehydrase and lipid transport